MLGKIHFLVKPIRERLARKLQVPSIPLCLEHLQSCGFNPGHIVDVGAYQGDFARDCLRIWPDVKISCFEPQPHMASKLAALARENPGQIAVFDCLLGAQEQEAVTLYQAETASSVLVEYEQKHPSIERPMRRLDEVKQEMRYGGCDFLKLDVQGYELEVLKGAETCLGAVQAILAEVNLLDIHKDVPLLPEFVQWLSFRGFVPYDICGMTRRPLDNALWQIDMLFVPMESRLRQDKRWGQ